MTIKKAADKLAAAWAAKKFRNEAESQRSDEARVLRHAVADAGMNRRAFGIAAACLRKHGLSERAYTA